MTTVGATATSPRHLLRARTAAMVTSRYGSGLLVVATAVVVGSVAASVQPDLVDPTTLASSPFYASVTATLLAVGLLASTIGIDVGELVSNRRTVLLAITVGVVAKAVMIGAVLWLTHDRDPAYAVLGLCVAQIDPLSVAALRDRFHLSRRGQAVLSAWASFDDPVTVLLTVYVGARILDDPDGALAAATAARPGHLALDVGFVVVLAAAWLLVRRPVGGRSADRRNAVRGGLLLVAAVVVAVRFDLLLGLAVAGLVVRPPLGGLPDRLATAAFLAAAFLLGLLLAAGVTVGEIGSGVLLGALAFGAQMVVAGTLTRGMNRYDRIRLVLGQQNGITAIILALAVTPAVPAAPAIVGVAILVVGVLHAGTNRGVRQPADRRQLVVP